MFKNKTKRVVISGIMLALAVVIPQAFHIIPVGNTGGVFLPMHIPVLLNGILCGPIYGLIVGGLSPIISALMTGMPAVARLPFMVVELMVYGFTIGLFYDLKKNTNKYFRLYSSLIDALVMGRVAYFLSLVAAVYLLGMKNLSVIAVVDALVLGIPGIIIQIVLIPPIIAAVNGTVIYNGKKTLGRTNTFVCKNGKKVFKSEKRGVAPVVELLETDPDMLKGAYVADKVIGKAAALLLIKGGIKTLYTDVISEKAIKVLENYGKISVSYKTKVPYIVNRTKDGMCPMEKATYDIEEPEEAFKVIKATMEALKKGTESVKEINSETSGEMIKTNLEKHATITKIMGNVPVFSYEITDSTNLRAKEYVKTQKRSTAEGEKKTSVETDTKNAIKAVFIADEQTNGRGRLDRTFYSPKATGIYMSILLSADSIREDMQLVTVGTAVAVCNAIKEVCGIELGIKWVNDLYKNGKKVCGILAEAVCDEDTGAISDIVVGIGINCDTKDFPEDLEKTAASLTDGTDTHFNRDELILKISENVADLVGHLSEQSVMETYRKMSIMYGREVIYVHKGKEKCGIVKDINDAGNLVITLNDGTEEMLSSGEVSVKGDWN